MLWTVLSILVLVLSFIPISASAQVSARDPQQMTLQDAVNGYQSTANGHAGLTEDWSNHRLVFSRPVAGSPAYQKVTREPRYWMQQLSRLRGAVANNADDSMLEAPQAKTKVRASKAKMKNDWNVSLGAGIVKPNTYPAKFSFSTTTASCSSDFVVFPTGTAGGSSQATIVAENELYSSCGGSPSVYWQYNTAYTRGLAADGGTVTTSSVLYTDGIQVAFIQVNSSGLASLIILKTANNSSLVQMDTATNNVSPSNFRSCSAPCMTRINFEGGESDTWSAPFYDYNNDNLYVGDDGVYLHKFTGVFQGTPAELFNSAWPVVLSTSVASPVYDSNSGYVFVGTTGGVLYAVGSGNQSTTSGAIHGTSNNLTSGSSAGVGIYDAPLVDSTTGEVYAFVGTAANSSKVNCFPNDNCVFQFPTSFTSGFGTKDQDVNVGGGGFYFFDGDFDNIYYSTSGGTAGNIYVVGRTGGFGGILYRIPFSSSGVIGTPVTVGSRINDTSYYAYASPATEFCNNGTSACTVSGGKTTAGTDRLFVSVYKSGLELPCEDKTGHGCILSYDISNPSSISVAGENRTTYADPGCWVTGGIIIDNSVPSGTQGGASQIYYNALDSAATNLCGNAGTGTMSGIQASQ